MLDKEMAEEKLEGLENEVEELKEKLAVVQVEMGVLKGEDGELHSFFYLSDDDGLLCREYDWC